MGVGGVTEFQFITSRAIRDRYVATLERISRERHEAAYEWTRLRWWEWRKRHRLHRMLFGVGGWRVTGLEDAPIPRRVVLRRGRMRVLEP